MKIIYLTLHHTLSTAPVLRLVEALEQQPRFRRGAGTCDGTVGTFTR